MGDYQLPLVANKCISINKWNHKTVGERTEFWFLLIKKLFIMYVHKPAPIINIFGIYGAEITHSIL